MAYLKILCQHSLRGTAKNTRDSVSLSRVQTVFLLVVTVAPDDMEVDFEIVVHELFQSFSVLECQRGINVSGSTILN